MTIIWIVPIFAVFILASLGTQNVFAEPGNTEVIWQVFNNGFSELSINDPDGIAQIERVDFDLTFHGCSTNVAPFGVLVPRIVAVSDCQNPRDVTEWMITETGAICVSGSCLPDTVPEVTISALPSTGVSPLEVDFTCSVVGGNVPFTFEWDFGDGESSIIQNPTHTYDEADVFTAKCTVTDKDEDVGSSSTEITVELPITPVEIDIKPGSDPNSINPNSNGVIPVALLGSDTFDVDVMDEVTIDFATSNAKPIHEKAHFEDVNDDGFTDLVTHYRVQDTGIAFGDTEACLTGETLDGTPIRGCDSVRTPGPRTR